MFAPSRETAFRVTQRPPLPKYKTRWGSLVLDEKKLLKVAMTPDLCPPGGFPEDKLKTLSKISKPAVKVSGEAIQSTKPEDARGRNGYHLIQYFPFGGSSKVLEGRQEFVDSIDYRQSGNVFITWIPVWINSMPKILELPPEVFDNITEHLEWPILYLLRQTCKVFDSYLGPKIDNAITKHLRENSSRTSVCWQFGNEDTQTITVIPNDQFIDGYSIRVLRHANECLFDWNLGHSDNVWANYYDIRDAYLILRFPLKTFQHLMNETSPLKLFARDMQLTDPPCNNFNVSLVIYEPPRGKAITVKDWNVSNDSGVRLEDVLRAVLSDTVPTDEYALYVRLKAWKSVCPTDRHTNDVHNAGQWVPTRKARLGPGAQYGSPYRYTAEETRRMLSAEVRQVQDTLTTSTAITTVPGDSDASDIRTWLESSN